MDYYRHHYNHYHCFFKKMKRVLLDKEWVELKEMIEAIVKEHDDNTSFTEDNVGFGIIVNLMMDCYEHGRKHELPPYWNDAYKVYIQRKSPEYKAYVYYKEKLKELEPKLQHLEQLDMTELTGGPMRTFLEKNRNKSLKKQKLKK